MIDVDVVIEATSKYIWNDKYRNYAPTEFLIKGSYPAAIKAYEESLGELVLPYNDIDVFVKVPDPEKDSRCDKNAKKASFIESKYVKGLIPHHKNLSVQVSVICDWDPDFLVLQWSDVNAVTVGFTVTPPPPYEEEEASPATASFGRWIWNPSKFGHFLHTKTLELETDIVLKRQNYDSAKSVVRLLRKAKQCHMDYKLPPSDELHTLLHGKVLPPSYKRMYDRLNKADKNMIEKDYDFIDVPVEEEEEVEGSDTGDDESSWTMFARKGEEVPTPPRILTTCGYNNGRYYSCAKPVVGGADPSVQSAPSDSGGGSTVVAADSTTSWANSMFDMVETVVATFTTVLIAAFM